MPDIEPFSPRGMFHEGWSAEVDDYAIVCGWALKGKLFIVGDVVGDAVRDAVGDAVGDTEGNVVRDAVGIAVGEEAFGHESHVTGQSSQMSFCPHLLRISTSPSFFTHQHQFNVFLLIIHSSVLSVQLVDYGCGVNATGAV